MAWCMFCEKLGLEGAKGMNDILTKAQPYINYEGKLLKEMENGWGSRKLIHSRTTEVDLELLIPDSGAERPIPKMG